MWRSTMYVAAPHAAHYENCMTALRAEKPVLCEKPMAMHQAEAKALFAGAHARGVFLMEGISHSVAAACPWDKRPCASDLLTNNNAEIRRLKQRIEQLSHDKEVGFVGWKFDGGEAVANTDNNRLQLLFDERPGAEQRTTLKQNGFHWSPTEQAWQRQLTDNAIYACSRIGFVQPFDGQKPTALQPKTAKKDTPER